MAVCSRTRGCASDTKQGRGHRQRTPLVEPGFGCARPCGSHTHCARRYIEGRLAFACTPEKPGSGMQVGKGAGASPIFNNLVVTPSPKALGRASATEVPSALALWRPWTASAVASAPAACLASWADPLSAVGARTLVSRSDCFGN